MAKLTYIKLFVDYLDAIEPLGDAERGRLFTSLLEYARTGVAPQLNGNERFLFPMMRASLDRDMAEMDDISKARSEAGKKSAEARASKPKQNKQVPAKASKPSKDKDKDKDKEEDNIPPNPQGGDYIPYAEIADFLNETAGTSYSASGEKTKSCIRARWNDGFRLDDFKAVIVKKSAQWKGTDMAKYLRPETLFGTKFEGYLNEGGTNGGKPAGNAESQRVGHYL